MVAGPVWIETMADALRWLGVPPNAAVAVKDEKPVVPPPAVSADEEDGEDDGFVAAVDDPRAHSGPASEVPDFSGMSMAEALVAAHKAGLRLEVRGSGLATAQSPGPGEARRGAACRVVFTPPG
jgi:cell division protein FtsI (penicillin-binding protein 3)